MKLKVNLFPFPSPSPSSTLDSSPFSSPTPSHSLTLTKDIRENFLFSVTLFTFLFFSVMRFTFLFSVTLFTVRERERGKFYKLIALVPLVIAFFSLSSHLVLSSSVPPSRWWRQWSRSYSLQVFAHLHIVLYVCSLSCMYVCTRTCACMCACVCTCARQEDHHACCNITCAHMVHTEVGTR